MFKYSKNKAYIHYLYCIIHKFFVLYSINYTNLIKSLLYYSQLNVHYSIFSVHITILNIIIQKISNLYIITLIYSKISELFQIFME